MPDVGAVPRSLAFSSLTGAAATGSFGRGGLKMSRSVMREKAESGRLAAGAVSAGGGARETVGRVRYAPAIHVLMMLADRNAAIASSRSCPEASKVRGESIRCRRAIDESYWGCKQTRCTAGWLRLLLVTATLRVR